MNANQDKLPKMKDGTPIYLGDEVWVLQDGFEEWPHERAALVKIDSMSIGTAFDQYNGAFTLSSEDGWEGGNLDCYQAKGEVPGDQEMILAREEALS